MRYKNSNQRTRDYLEKFDKNEILQKLVGTDTPVILDIGANIGQTVEKLKTIWDKAVVHSIEPLPEAFQELYLTKGILEDVHVYNHALGSVNGWQEFNVNKHQPMLSGFYKLNENSKDSIAINKPEKAHKNFLESDSTQVPVMTLDTFTENNNIKNIDIIKMDVQGAEPEILEHGIETLKNTRIVLTELSLYDLYEKQCSFYDIEKTLIPLGFQLFDVAHVSKNPMNGRTDWVDLIYFKKS